MSFHVLLVKPGFYHRDGTKCSPTITPCLTPKFPEDTEGDHLPATPPTPDPWMWKCHKCLKKYKFEATTRCLDGVHYFCKTSNSIINKLRGDTRQEGSRACKSIFDSTGWKKFKAWQKQKFEPAQNEQGQKRAGIPPEAQPAKRRMLSFRTHG
ncbi:hypothetical protein I7I51_07094 [Histoplasma capsulatum]|uniref:Uncharacterized protein n=1 Tax=Ajellomyces capsulatus TaxID=5037 RepID=A0A8A1MQ93_AJECA|nr:hypothetical protein I7I51_07094 [Histoplasma capsulatum]